jgi:imidazolonepropionase-like amidohydrolase
MLLSAWASLATLGAAPRETTTPVEGLRDASPRTHALVGARLVLGPGKVVEKGTVVVRDGVIVAAGAEVAVPAEARVWDVAGATVYPGFIESYSTAFLPEAWKPAAAGAATRSPFFASGSTATAAATDAGGARAWNSRVAPEREARSVLAADARTAERMRGLGFTVAHIVPARGIFRGQSALVSLSGASFNQSLVRGSVAQTAAFEFGGFFDATVRYPTSLMGSIALIRQTLLDAQWHVAAQAAYARHGGNGPERPEANDTLAALAPAIDGRQLVLFETQDELDIERAQKIATEFKLRLALRGNGTEYRVLPRLAAAKTPVVLPLNFPDAPEIETPEKAADVTLDQLQHWELAPTNPGRLAAAGVPIALTTAELRRESEFWSKLRAAVKAGLTSDQALAALTTTPAELLGVAATHGTVAPGKVANLVVASGDLFTSDDAEIQLVFVDGDAFEQDSWKRYDARGTWSATWTGANGPAELVIRGAKPGRVRAKAAGKDVTAVAQKDGVLLLAPAEVFGAAAGTVRLSARGFGEELAGTGELPDGTAFRWTAQRTGPAPAEEPRGPRGPRGAAKDGEVAEKPVPAKAPDAVAEKPAEAKPAEKPADKPDAKKLLASTTYPAGAYGRSAAPTQPEWVLVKNATLWTSAKAGVLKNADLLVHAGKIEKVGPGLTAPAGATVIDATGMHVSPGIIDCHSHIAIQRGVNEGGASVTCEVRIEDVLDPTDINIYWQLAGGVTASNLLHGSANSIGGQNAVIKLRWGTDAQGLLVAGAKPGVKFALGENPTQANAFRTMARTRYPITRMGVRETILDTFKRAADYERAWTDFKAGRASIPPRRDLRLEAAVEMLHGDRLIHIHSYRQDEVLMFIRLAQDLKLPVATFQHILEGYKVAPEIAQLGAGASTFSDWWAFKYEVVDAVPFNGTMLHRAGVLTSFNSDDAEMARRLNTEAAKAVKYGGLTPEEALALVTINPAKQLQLGDRLGSLEPGKDADFVIWSAAPLSTAARAEQTWVDGRRYFDRTEDAALRAANVAERVALIQKALPARQRALAGGPPGGGDGGEGGGDGPALPPMLRALLGAYLHETDEFRAIYHHGGDAHNCSSHFGGFHQ